MFERFKRTKQLNENKQEQTQESPYIKDHEFSRIATDLLSPELIEQKEMYRKHILTMAERTLDNSNNVNIKGDLEFRESPDYSRSTELSSDTTRLSVKEWHYRGVGYRYSIVGEIEGMHVQLVSGFDSDQGSGNSRIVMSDTKLDDEFLLKKSELDSIHLYMDEDAFQVNVIPGHNAEGTISSLSEVLNKVDATLRDFTEDQE